MMLYEEEITDATFQSAVLMHHFSRENSFPAHIGAAYLAGNQEERAKLVVAFPDLFAKFTNFKDRRTHT